MQKSKVQKNTFIAGTFAVIIIVLAIGFLSAYFINKDSKYLFLTTIIFFLTILWAIGIIASLYSKEHGIYASVLTLNYLLSVYIVHIIHYDNYYGLEFSYFWYLTAFLAWIGIVGSTYYVLKKK